MWKRIPHLMQQHETPKKGYNINKVKCFTIIHTSCENQKLNKSGPKIT